MSSNCGDERDLFARAAAVDAEDLGDRLIIADATGENWMVLRGTAIDIWRALARPKASEQLVIELESFAAEPAVRLTLVPST